MQAQPNQRPQRNRHQLVLREEFTTHLYRAFEAGKARRKHLIWPKAPAHGIVHGQAEAKCCHQLVQLGHTVHAAQQYEFGHRAGQRCAPSAHQHGDSVQRSAVAPGGKPVRYPMRREQRTEHEKTAVRKIDDARDAENQRQPGSHQEQRGGVTQPVEQLDDD